MAGAVIDGVWFSGIPGRRGMSRRGKSKGYVTFEGLVVIALMVGDGILFSNIPFIKRSR